MHSSMGEAIPNIRVAELAMAPQRRKQEPRPVARIGTRYLENYLQWAFSGPCLLVKFLRRQPGSVHTDFFVPDATARGGRPEYRCIHGKNRYCHPWLAW